MPYLNPRIADADVRVMSSNILFDKTLPDRLPLIADYYRASDADLIGMQEVNRVGTALFETLGDIYAPVALRHPEDKHCFTPILYRRDRFDLLEGGSHVVCDRYYPSNMAYNSGETLSVEDIYELNRPCVARLAPDAIVYLDVPPEVTRARRAADRASEEIYDADEKQRKVRESFESALAHVAKMEGEEKIIRINAARPLDDVADEIWARVKALLFE